MGIFNAIAAATGAVASHINQGWAQHNSASEARAADARSYHYWHKQQLNHYPLMRQSLEKAGFNPMLAVANGASGASSMPSTHQGQSFLGDMVGSAKDAAELSNAISDLWKDQARQRDADWMKTRKEQELLSAQIKKLEADTKSVQNSTSISIEREGRDSILDWFDTFSPLGLGLGGYWLGKGKKGSPVSSVPPVLPMKAPSKIPYGRFMRFISPSIAPLIGAGLMSSYIYGDEKRRKVYSDHFKNNYKHNPYMFSPLR